MRGVLSDGVLVYCGGYLGELPKKFRTNDAMKVKIVKNPNFINEIAKIPILLMNSLKIPILLMKSLKIQILFINFERTIP